MIATAITTWRHWRIDTVGAGVMLGLLAAAYLVQVRPLLAERQRSAELAADLTAHQESLAQTRRAAQTARTRLEVLEHALAQVSLTLESADQLNLRLARLTELATSLGLQLDEVEPGAAQTRAHHETVAIRLRGRGGYPQAVDFLHQLHARFPDVGVTQFELTGSPGSQAPGVLGLTLLWYTAPPKQPAGPRDG